MKNQNQRDLEKHWAKQAKKRTPAEQLRYRAEKLRKQIESSKAPPSGDGTEPEAVPAETHKSRSQSQKKSQ